MSRCLIARSLGSEQERPSSCVLCERRKITRKKKQQRIFLAHARKKRSSGAMCARHERLLDRHIGCCCKLAIRLLVYIYIYLSRSLSGCASSACGRFRRENKTKTREQRPVSRCPAYVQQCVTVELYMHVERAVGRITHIL